MLAAEDSSLMSQKTSVSPGTRPSPLGKYPVPYDGTIRLVGHRVREVQPGIVEVKAQVGCQGRTFDGEMSGPAAPPERLKVPAMATIRALDSLIRTLYRGVSYPTLVLDDVVEWSLDNSPVAVVMVTATEKTTSTPFVAACPLVGMSDLAIILATLQATSRTVSRWLAQGDTLPPSGEPERPQ